MLSRADRCVVLPDRRVKTEHSPAPSQCTYRCMVLPDATIEVFSAGRATSQCTYRCVVLPDVIIIAAFAMTTMGLNAPTGAWCSLTATAVAVIIIVFVSMHLQVRGAP